MRAKIPVLVLTLTLTFLMAMPATNIPSVYAVTQSGPTAWSPFGPRSDTLLISVFGDFNAMFTAFSSGQIDITDWPVNPADLSSFGANPDFFLTNAEGEFGIFEMDRNHHGSFLGKVLTAARTTSPPGILSSSTAAGCSIGFGGLNIALKNLEEGSALVQDGDNQLKASGPVAVAPVKDVGIKVMNDRNNLAADTFQTGGTADQPLRGGFKENEKVSAELRSEIQYVDGAGGAVNVYDDGIDTAYWDNDNTGTFTADDTKIKGTADATGQTGVANGTGAHFKIVAAAPLPAPPVPDKGPGKSGLYSIPCTLAGTYTISTSVYRGSATVFVGSAQIVTVDFGVNYNSDSTVSVTNADREIGRALTHMLDNPNYQGIPPIAGQSDYLDIQAPAAQGLINLGGPSAPSRIAQAVLDEDCAFHPWKTPCSPSSAYNLTPDNIAAGSVWYGNDAVVRLANHGFSGADDLRAACDHLVNAGFTLVGGTCLDLVAALTSASQPGSYAHFDAAGQQVIMYGRTDPKRRAFSAIFADTINAFFGTPNAGGTIRYGTTITPQYFTIGQVVDIVFAGPPDLDDWDLYSGGWSLGSTPDHLWALYNSDFSGGVCAGVPEEFPNNYSFYCSAKHDGETNAGQFSTTLADANTFFSRAVLSEHRDVMTIPVLSLVSQFVALNGWNHQASGRSSLVQQLGHGFQAASGFYSMLNMQQVPGYTPANAIYKPGGGVDGLIRRGFSQGFDKLSLFNALTVWDFDSLVLIYDSMLATDPRTGATSAQSMDWMTTSHSEVIKTLPDGTIQTVQTWKLRNDVRFHDGVAVTAADVAYTILAYRDIPSANLQPSVAPVISATALDSKTVQVVLEQASAFFTGNIGGLPILPKHVWAPICGDPPNPASQCGNPAFDPMAAGLMIGSGPWRCENIATGVVGGTCTQNADGSPGTQAITIGGRMVLKRNVDYVRGVPGVLGTSLHKISWADKNNDGTVNILDIADAALSFGAPNAYWNNPLFGVDSTKVDIGEIATIAFYYDAGITKPFAPLALLALDPLIDPFCTPGTAGTPSTSCA